MKGDDDGPIAEDDDDFTEYDEEFEEKRLYDSVTNFMEKKIV